MRVLIVPASRFGGTAEIGRAMARTLRAEGLDVDVSQPDQMFNLSPYGAHIIGSSVYFGEWLDSAVTFVEGHANEIRSKPTWLFSSGPFGPGTPEEPIRAGVVDGLMELSGAVEHRLFGGRLELDRLPTRERFMAGWVGAHDTDLRDWDEIEKWTLGIARTLTGAPTKVELDRHSAPRTHDSGTMARDELGMILDVTPGDYEGFERKLLEGTGHEVKVCHGPEERGGVCPMLEGEVCNLIDEAHGVVFKLDLDRETHRRILQNYKRILPDGAPIAVALQPGQEDTYAEMLNGVHVWSHQPTSSDLDGFAALVEAADYSR